METKDNVHIAWLRCKIALVLDSTRSAKVYKMNPNRRLEDYNCMMDLITRIIYDDTRCDKIEATHWKKLHNKVKKEWNSE